MNPVFDNTWLTWALLVMHLIVLVALVASFTLLRFSAAEYLEHKRLNTQIHEELKQVYKAEQDFLSMANAELGPQTTKYLMDAYFTKNPI